jgi:hypothetical protein
MKLLSGVDVGAVFCFCGHGNDHLCFLLVLSILTMRLIVSSSRMMLNYGFNIYVRHL